jgi:2-polyprenyl-3-methyl-5-hydroxy-6-metoxy-1,4-benzoquinol methylase
MVRFDFQCLSKICGLRKELDIMENRKFQLNKDSLDEFVSIVDCSGGPIGLNQKWPDHTYKPSFNIDESIDPYSDEYVAQQLALYVEISGRNIDQYTNEHTDFQLDKHINHINPYGLRDQNSLNHHFMRLSIMLSAASQPASARVLDMGAGWGLSSEYFATLGCDVTAVDINEDFVTLINKRSKRFSNGINAIHGDFETNIFLRKFNLVCFYECLHHAIRPWAVIDAAKRQLSPNGQICFAGEPIQSIWWKHWGMRLDPLSVYCIKKFGWFESGWSEAFIQDVFKRAGMSVNMRISDEKDVGYIGIATYPTAKIRTIDEDAFMTTNFGDGWIGDAPYMICSGTAYIDKGILAGASLVRLSVKNFRGKDLEILVTELQSGRKERCILVPGYNEFDFEAGDDLSYRIEAETWVPAEEFDSIDSRRLSFHLVAIECWE